MDSHDKIVASVRELLGEIQKLKAEKDDATNNPVKANYLQCKIFRKFDVIKSLMASSRDKMEAMKEEVLLNKKQVGAEDEDLKKMRVPKHLRAKALVEWTKKEEADATFPYFHLPPEVRSVILGYLTSPSDQLNLLKVVPSDGHMMGWQMGALQLELVLPIILKKEGEEGQYEILMKLCHASENLHGVVKNLMKRCVKYEDPNSLHVNFLLRNTKRMVEVAPKDLALNPFPVTISLEFDGIENSESRLNQFQVLRQFGRHVWSVSLFLASMPVLQAIQLLRDCLELMPNLRRLSVFLHLVPLPYSLDRNEIIETFRGVQLPELPHLKVLNVRGSKMKPVAQKILRKYQSGLVFLGTDKFSMVSPRGRNRYPQLCVLMARDVQQTDASMIASRLKPFVGAALKSMSLDIGYQSNSKEHFGSLMSALSQFRNTLKDLCVKFSSVPEPSWCVTGLDWLPQVNFPKVKTLRVKNYPGSWDMLLHFPALEQLTLHLYKSNYDFFKAIGLSEIVELSCDEDKMYTSSIWKLLPFLDYISILKGFGFPLLQVTRSQCLAYQERLDRVMEDGCSGEH